MTTIVLPPTGLGYVLTRAVDESHRRVCRPSAVRICGLCGGHSNADTRQITEAKFADGWTIALMVAESTEAHLKLERAANHLAAMRAAMDAWASDAALGVRAEISDDRLTVRYLVSTKENPPLRTWALILGDGLHNARASLDALVWGYCDHDSLTVDQQRLIQWPMVVDAAKWAGVASRQLRALPAHVVDAIGACQPFNLPGDGGSSALKLLHDLDIVDKHRLTIDARVRLSQVEHSATVSFESEGAAARFEQGEHEYNGNVTLEDGSLVGTQRFLDRVESVSGGLALTFQLQVAHHAMTWPPTDLLAMLIDAASQTVDAIDQIAGQQTS